MKRTVTMLSTFLLLCVLCPPVHAETMTFTKEYVYQAGKIDNKDSSRIIALREAKRLLREDFVLWIGKQMPAATPDMTKDRMTALAAGVLPMEVTDEKWDGRACRIGLKAAADSSDAVKLLEGLRRDPEKTAELEALRKRSEDLLLSVGKLKETWAAAKGRKKELEKKKYLEAIKAMTALDWAEQGYGEAVRGSLREAVRAFDRAVATTPKDPNLYYIRGSLYAQSRKYPNAIQDFSQAIALDPALVPAYIRRGFAAFSLGQHEPAIRDFDRAIELDPKRWAAYNGRGIVNANRGKFDEAIRDFDRAIEGSPHFVSAYMNRGLAYFNGGRFERAIQDFRAAVGEDPQLTAAYLYMGLSHSGLRQYDEAIGDFGKAIALDPGLAAAYYNLARIYALKGETRMAMDDLGKAIRLHPEFGPKAKSEADFEKIRREREFIELTGR